MKPSVNFEDYLDLSDWLDAVERNVEDLADIANAATKPREQRILSRSELRRDMESASEDLRQLFKAGWRGIRNPRRTS